MSTLPCEFFLLHTQEKCKAFILQKGKTTQLHPEEPEIFRHAGLKYCCWSNFAHDMLEFRLVDLSLAQARDYRVTCEFKGEQFVHKIEFLEGDKVVFTEQYSDKSPFMLPDEFMAGLSPEELEASKSTQTLICRGVQVTYHDALGSGYCNGIFQNQELVGDVGHFTCLQDLLECLVDRIAKLMRKVKSKTSSCNTQEDGSPEDSNRREDIDVRGIIAEMILVPLNVINCLKDSSIEVSKRNFMIHKREDQGSDYLSGILMLLDVFVVPLIEEVKKQFKKNDFAWNCSAELDSGEMFEEEESQKDQEGNPEDMQADPLPEGYDQLDQNHRVIKDLEDWIQEIRSLLMKENWINSDFKKELRYRCSLQDIYFHIKKVIWNGLESDEGANLVLEAMKQIEKSQAKRDEERKVIMASPGSKVLIGRLTDDRSRGLMFTFTSEYLKKKYGKYLAFNILDQKIKAYPFAMFKRNFGQYAVEFKEKTLTWQSKGQPSISGQLDVKVECHKHCFTQSSCFLITNNRVEDGYQTVVHRIDFGRLASGQPPVLQLGYMVFDDNVSINPKIAEGDAMIVCLHNSCSKDFYVHFKKGEPADIREPQRVELNDICRLNTECFNGGGSDVEFANLDVVYRYASQIALQGDKMHLGCLPANWNGSKFLFGLSLRLIPGQTKPQVLEQGRLDLPSYESNYQYDMIITIAGRKGDAYFLLIEQQSGSYHIATFSRKSLVWLKTSGEPLLGAGARNLHASFDRKDKRLALFGYVKNASDGADQKIILLKQFKLNF